MGKIAAIVLAAGRSARMGSNKLLLPFRGKPLLCAALEAALGSGANPVICVVGPESPMPQKILAERGEFGRIRWAVNPEARTGRASSIRAGIAALPEECSAALFLPGDVPGVRTEEAVALLARYRETGAPAVIAVDGDGTLSHPVLFDRALFPELLTLKGDDGARGILADLDERVEKVVRRAAPLFDVDTPEDYRALLELEP